MAASTHPRSDDTAARSTSPWAVLAVCCISLFLVGVDSTAVNVALPAISDDLQASPRTIPWIVDAYTVMLAGLLISAGALGDRLGRRRIFRIGLSVFALASIGCSLAPTAGALIAARAVQGIGGAMLSPVALAIVVGVFTDPAARARAIGVWAAMFGVAMAVGPAIGGVLVDHIGWTAVFWINVPVAAATLTATHLVVPESRAAKPRVVDWPGQLLLALAITATIGTLVEVTHLSNGLTPTAWTAMATAVITAIAFVLRERHAPAPLLPLRLVAIVDFRRSVLGALAVFIAMSATVLTISTALQNDHGYDATAAGLSIVPLALAATVLPPVAGRIVATRGPRVPLGLAGTALTAAGALAMSGGSRPAVAVSIIAGLLVGAGLGLANPPITATAVGSLPPDYTGLAGGIVSTARQVGTAVGVALAATAASGIDIPIWPIVTACGLLVCVIGLRLGLVSSP